MRWLAQSLELSSHLKIIIIITNVTLINFNFMCSYLPHLVYLFSLPHISFTQLQSHLCVPGSQKCCSNPGNTPEVHSGLHLHLPQYV